jgi:hypothetical protein
MKSVFQSQDELTFAKVLALQDGICRRFGAADMIAGEWKSAETSISGRLDLQLEGLAINDLSVECVLTRGTRALEQIRQSYLQLEPLVGVSHVFRADYEFRVPTDAPSKSNWLSLLTVRGNRSFIFRLQRSDRAKATMQRVLEEAEIPARIIEESPGYLVQPTRRDFRVTTSFGDSQGRNPLAVKWQAKGSPAESIAAAETLVLAMAKEPGKSLKCSWEASTIMGEGADDLVALLNRQYLMLPKGKLQFSYCLKELEGLERVRTLLGPKAKLSAEAAVFRYPEEDRGVLWVETTPNGYKVELHLDDPDRIKELQRYLGVEFQWKADAVD